MKLRRLALPAALCLAGGAVATVLVAWGCAAIRAPVVVSSATNLMIQFGNDPELFMMDDPAVQRRLRDWKNDSTIRKWLEYDVDSRCPGMQLSQTMIGRLPEDLNWTIEDGEAMLLRVLGRHVEAPVRYQEGLACGWPWPSLRSTRVVAALPGAPPDLVASDASITLARGTARVMPPERGHRSAL